MPDSNVICTKCGTLFDRTERPTPAPVTTTTAQEREVPEEAFVSAPERREGMSRRSIVAIVCVVLGVMLVAGGLVYGLLIWPAQQYNHAVALMNEGSYEEAIAMFAERTDNPEAAQMIERCYYGWAIELVNKGAYTDAIAMLEAHPNYEGASDLLQEAYRRDLTVLMNAGSYEEALALLEVYPAADVDGTVAAEAAMGQARAQYAEGAYAEALATLEAMTPNDSVVALADEVRVVYGQALIAEGRLTEAEAVLEAVVGEAAVKQANAVRYQAKAAEQWADVKARVPGAVLEEARMVVDEELAFTFFKVSGAEAIYQVYRNGEFLAATDGLFGQAMDEDTTLATVMVVTYWNDLQTLKLDADQIMK